jgi:hypothetical protein
MSQTTKKIFKMKREKEKAFSVVVTTPTAI